MGWFRGSIRIPLKYAHVGIARSVNEVFEFSELSNRDEAANPINSFIHSFREFLWISEYPWTIAALTPSLFALWQCLSQVWVGLKEADDANGLAECQCRCLRFNKFLLHALSVDKIWPQLDTSISQCIDSVIISRTFHFYLTMGHLFSLYLLCIG